MKKVLSIALAVMMLLAAVPTVALAVTYISKVEINVVTPTVGSPVLTDSMMDADSGCTLKNIAWIDAATREYVVDGDFAEGEYILEAVFEAEEGYKFKNAESVEVIINSIEADTVVKNADGTLTATLSFTCEKEGIKLPSITNLIANIKIVLNAFMHFIGSMLGLK